MILPTTVVILARNEQEQIADCIGSVRDLVDEILVIDMESSDATASIASELGARVISHPLIPNFDLARSTGIRAARNEWILILDADEMPTRPLMESLHELIKNDRCDVAFLPRANFALSGFSPREGNFPEWQLRFFKRPWIDVDGYLGKIHTTYRPLPDARILKVSGRYPEHCLLHYSNPTLEFLWEKVNRYTSEEARTRWDAGHRSGLGGLRRTCWKFARRWLFSGACFEGWHAFWLCWISGIYEAFVQAKLWEMSLHDGLIPTTAMARSRMRRLVQDAMQNVASSSSQASS